MSSMDIGTGDDLSWTGPVQVFKHNHLKIKFGHLVAKLRHCSSQ